MAGGVGVPLMGRIADRYLAEALDPARTAAVLQQVVERFPAYVEGKAGTAGTYRGSVVRDALNAAETALNAYRGTGQIQGDATANALRAVVATQLPGEPAVAEAAAILQPAEARGGQVSFRYVAPAAIVLVIVFGSMYVADRRRGGYRAVRLERAPSAP
jgi:hypothetical protein